MNRKTVSDDALISTDIDSIIKYLASHKRVEMGALANEVGMKRDILKNWVSILEEEGYVKVEYHLLNEFVVWSGPADFEFSEEASVAEEKKPSPPPDYFEQPEFNPKNLSSGEGQAKPKESKARPAPKAVQEKPEHNYKEMEEDVVGQIKRMPQKPEPKAEPEEEAVELPEELEEPEAIEEAAEEEEAAQKAEEEKEEAEKTEKPIQEEIAPEEEFKAEERVRRIMERMREKVGGEDEIAKSVMSSFASEPEDASGKTDGAGSGGEKAPRIVAVPSRVPAKKGSERSVKQKIEEKENHELVREEVASLKRSLSEYMNEIRIRKDEIEKLRAEREQVLAKAYLPMESRFKAAFDSISESILEKEGKIIELKERLMELPNKIDDADRVQLALHSIREECNRTMVANKKELGGLMDNLKGEDARLKAGLEDMEHEIAANKSEVLTLSDTLSMLDGKEQEIKTKVEGLNDQLSEINNAIASSYATLTTLKEKRSELVDDVDELKATLDAKASEVSETYAKLTDVKKAEGIIADYLADYENKIADVEEYAGRSEQELAKLREFAEIKYMRGYLKELDSLSTSYDQEYDAARSQEQSIDERIDEAKKNMDELIKESRMLVKNIEKKTSGKDFEALLTDVKVRRDSMLAKVQEKTVEREKVEAEYPMLRRALTESKPQERKPESRKPSPKSSKKPAAKKQKKGGENKWKWKNKKKGRR